MKKTLITRRGFIGMIIASVSSVLGLVGCGREQQENTSKRATKISTLDQLKEGPNYFTLARIIIKKQGDELTAMSLVCTHLECVIRPNDSGGGFVCPCHGATFDSEGKVLTGPATRDLYRHPVTVDSSGNVLVQFGIRL